MVIKDDNNNLIIVDKYTLYCRTEVYTKINCKCENAYCDKSSFFQGADPAHDR